MRPSAHLGRLIVLGAIALATLAGVLIQAATEGPFIIEWAAEV